MSLTAPPPEGAAASPRGALSVRIRSLLPSGRVRRAVLILAGDAAVGQAIVALTMPIISRLYTPAEFGAATAAIALVTMVLTVTCLTYDHAVPLPKDDRTATDLLALAGLAAIALSLACAVVLVVAGDAILGALDIEGLEAYLWVLVVAQLAGGLTLALTGWAIRAREFGAISDSRVTQSVAMVGSQIGAGIAGVGAAGLLIGDAVGRVAATLRLAVRLRRTPRRRRETIRPTRAGLRYAARRYRRFPLIGSWPSLLNAVTLEAPLLLIVALYGGTAGGNFALASRLIAAPATLVVLSISQVFIAEAAEQVQRDPSGLKGLFTASLRKLIRTGIPAIALLAIPASLLVPFVFGDSWTDAGYYLAILTPVYMAQLVTSPFGGALDVLERQDLILLQELARLALIGVAIVGAHAAGLPAVWAVVLFSVAGTLSYVLYAAMTWHAVRTV